MRELSKIVIIITLFAIGCFACKNNEVDYCRYVDPFIGTSDNGHTFPGACLPFGLVQASPETGNDSWRYCSGFHFEDDSIIGFAQTHLNGTGCSDLGDVLILPFSGDIKGGVYKNKFDRSRQIAKPGYYAVHFPDYAIDVEVTATEHTAFYQFTYNQEADPRLLVDLQSGVVWDQEALRTHVLEAKMNMPDSFTITGSQTVSNWVTRQYFYVIKFDKPYSVKEELPAREGEKGKRLVLQFDLEKGEKLQTKVAISSVSIEGATASMEKENPGWDFDQVKEQAHDKWNDLFSTIEIEGSEEQKINFYTSLYHLYIQPNNIADTDGQYRGVNDSVFTSSTGVYYSTFSLWDTYRAAHPLYTILIPEKVNDFVQSMLDHHKVQGFLPIWTLWGKDNYCMIGNHAVPVIVEAYLKGFNGFDPEEAFEAIKTSLTVSHEKSDWEVYMKYGYYPFDIIEVESVSRTLESAYDDYCAALMAKALGKQADYEYFLERSQFYKNLFDPETKLVRGKDSAGKWREPFDQFILSHASTSGGDYTEGNAWQYTWHVQQDPLGLIDLMGGKEACALKLDSLFVLQETSESEGFVSDVTGLIGQYAHGNEPSHHVAYFYNFLDQPWKTQELVREIFDRFYQPKPDGLCGNDDCGQMSAWYIFSAMGFYPFDPVSMEYMIGAPQIPKATVKLANEKMFVMEAHQLSKENKYVKSVMLNGKPLEGFKITHADIMDGGKLEFEMTDKPY
jgi:predicted alpha-1,2-mannosidase